MNAIPQKLEDERSQGATVTFTDGSLMESGGGAAAVSSTKVRTLGCSSTNMTNNKLELLAIALALAQFTDSRTQDPTLPNRLSIFSDSQVALKQAHDLLKPKPMQYLASLVKKLIGKLSNIEIKLFWVPVHEQIEGNEEADEAAKEAAEEGTNNTSLLPMILSKLLQTTRTTFHLRTADFVTGREDLKTQPKRIADSLAWLGKGQAGAIFQLQLGHSPLNEYLQRFNHHATGKCETCKAPETVPHFVMYCHWFKHQRRWLRKRLKEDKVKVNPFSLKSLLNTPDAFPKLAQFFLDTGRFSYLRLYSDEKKRVTKKKPRKARNTR